ncbi:MAG: putative transport system permease protein [Solirubrobacteraceae bacterium]|nr:putative transport system permease protein [Solirubrobacteraceae bacterium]MEA2242180.1 putative transport system permease protein [Solirubrobacteraceae bacterium]
MARSQVATLEDMPVVELREISRTYGSDPPVHALRGVDLTVDRGDAIAIVGPSGSGKSTLLNIVGCLDRPTSGTYLIDGNDTATLGEGELAALRGRLIGFVFQTFNLLAHRTVLENVMLAEVYLGRPREGRRQRAMAALDRVGIGERADFPPKKLSGGQQQRVAIARALMGSPSLLLCDEPTGNLDSVNSASVLALFEDLVADGMTMLLITHEESVAERMPRRTSITDGRLTEHA